MLSGINELFLRVGPLALLVQIGLCVHVYRTGRPYWWIWIILFGSVVGCLLYAILELLPAARRTGPRSLTTSWFVPQCVIIRRAREQLQASDTVENRLTLASLLYDQGNKEEAERVAAHCASGVFKDDPEVIAKVAWHKIEVGKLAEAETLIAQANIRNNTFARNRLELLKARILFGQQRYAEAKVAFSSLRAAHLGEEPKYYTALCHGLLGDTEAAVSLLNGIIKSFRKGTTVWRRSEKEWYHASRRALKEIRRRLIPSAAQRRVFSRNGGSRASRR